MRTTIGPISFTMTSSQPAPGRVFLPPARSSAWWVATVATWTSSVRATASFLEQPHNFCLSSRSSCGFVYVAGASRRARRARRRTRARAASAAASRTTSPRMRVQDEAPRRRLRPRLRVRPAIPEQGREEGGERDVADEGAGVGHRVRAALPALRCGWRWPPARNLADLGCEEVRRRSRQIRLRCDLRIQSGTAVQPPPSRRAMVAALLSSLALGLSISPPRVEPLRWASTPSRRWSSAFPAFARPTSSAGRRAARATASTRCGRSRRARPSVATRASSSSGRSTWTASSAPTTLRPRRERAAHARRAGPDAVELVPLHEPQRPPRQRRGVYERHRLLRVLRGRQGHLAGRGAADRLCAAPDARPKIAP